MGLIKILASLGFNWEIWGIAAFDASIVKAHSCGPRTARGKVSLTGRSICATGTPFQFFGKLAWKGHGAAGPDSTLGRNFFKGDNGLTQKQDSFGAKLGQPMGGGHYPNHPTGSGGF